MIGDVLASTVICQAIKSVHPEWELHYLIQPHTKEVVLNHPSIDQIVLFDPKKINSFPRLVSFGKKLSSQKYDIIIDAYGKLESIIPAYFSKTPIRIGFKKTLTNLLYTHTIEPKKNIQGSAIQHRMQLANHLLPVAAPIEFPTIHLTIDEKKMAYSKMEKALNMNKPIVMISLLGSDPSKSLPAVTMARMLNLIATRQEIQLVFNYMPSQEKEALAIYEMCNPTTRSRINKDFYTENLREFIAVLSHCDAIIGNEGGAINMGKALRVPTFTIFSPWINKTSWNMLDNQKEHISVHLSDFRPELYDQKHAKIYKKQSLDLYQLLQLDDFKSDLEQFVDHITLKKTL